ncbi:2801_t:CDS:2 [Dentiscutata heterogama]|uniref:2801_t:CDS:1 n=1 Tax=Dentiscutata heterogama TaxID=1316150 RepID=A0ACA9K0E5_9GLOM|nr:2801_t:CDS:2 [Dentiscutata heterogama]
MSSANNDIGINDDNNENIIDKIRWFYNNLEGLLKQNNHALNSGVQKFVEIYKQHRSAQNTYGGKRIRVQVTATSRRRVSLSHELRKVHQGSPRKNTQTNDTETTQKLNRSIMPAQKRHPKKRSYNLNWALKENRPNAVK